MSAINLSVNQQQAQENSDNFKTFSFEGKDVRVIMEDGVPWFVGKDVATVLGYERPTKAVADHVDEDDRNMIDGKTQSQFGIELGQRGGWLINESGLYSLILSSKLPSAKRFKRWIFGELKSMFQNKIYSKDIKKLDKQENFITFSFCGKDVQIVMQDNDPWFVLKEVCDILELSNSRMVAETLDEDEKGVSKVYTLGGMQDATIVSEPGLYKVIMRSNKPQAKAFTRWVTHDVLPELRKNGAYVANNTVDKEKQSKDDYHLINAKTQQEKVAIQRAKMLERMAEKQENPDYRQILEAHAVKELTGTFALPLPSLEEKTYSATEIGKLFGVSSQRIGRIANQLNLKTTENGKWFKDKSPNAEKEVSVFRYYERAIPLFREAMV